MGPALLKGIFSGWRQITKGKIKQSQVGLSTTEKTKKAYNSELVGTGWARRLELRSEGSLVLA